MIPDSTWILEQNYSTIISYRCRMIIVRRCPPKIKNFKRSLVTVSSSSMSAQHSTSDGGSSSTVVGGGTGSTYDWSNAFSTENKLRTIQILSTDRENSQFNIPWDDPTYKKAAVLIPFCYDLKGRPSILYNLRSAKLKKHRGEISFPGGAIDPEDNNDPVTAALRETHEELGLPPESIVVWTSLRVFPTILSHMGVVPVLGFINNGQVDPKILQVNPDEVDHAFTITLEHLCNEENWGEGTERKHKGTSYLMPKWKNLRVFNGSEEIQLWGLTAFITHLALSALLPSDVYKRELPILTLETRDSKSTAQSSQTNDSNTNKPKL